MHPEDVEAATGVRPVSERLLVQRHFEAAHEVPIPVGEGGHGGGDALLLRDVFAGPVPDPLHRTASWRDGVRSVVVGIAANSSLESGQAVRVDDLDLGPAAAALARPDPSRPAWRTLPPPSGIGFRGRKVCVLHAGEGAWARGQREGTTTARPVRVPACSRSYASGASSRENVSVCTSRTPWWASSTSSISSLREPQ